MAEQPHIHSSTCGCANEGKDTGQYESLYNAIKHHQIRGFNEFEDNSAKKIFKSYQEHKDNNKDFLLSNDDDPELLIYVPFNTNVKIKSISVQAAGDSRPTALKLFINRDDLDFSTAAQAQPVDTITLKDDSAGNHDYLLKFQKFQAVHSIWLYFPSCVGGEQSQINYIAFKGISTNVNRSAPLVSYEAIPQPEDHSQSIKDTIAKQSHIE
jgi:hypothetical protein